jgi:polar amino acid transport system ATP-binding protein
MRRLARDGMTMMVVTHEMAFAREVGDRVVFMDEGVIVEEGPAAQVIADPQTDRARVFLHRVLHPTDVSDLGETEPDKTPGALGRKRKPPPGTGHVPLTVR